MGNITCPECKGERLRKESLAFTVGGMNITKLTNFPIGDVCDLLDRIELSESERMIAAPILKEIKARIGFLISVGLYYLTLARSSGTLSGSEGSENQAGNPDRIGVDWCIIYPRRAKHWSSPKGQ